MKNLLIGHEVHLITVCYKDMESVQSEVFIHTHISSLSILPVRFLFVQIMTKRTLSGI